MIIGIEWMDIIYISLISIIFGFIVHMETQINTLKTMMEEHVKFDSEKSKLKNGNKKD